MLVWIVEQFRHAFCVHDLTFNSRINVFESTDTYGKGLPVYRKETYICKRCGWMKQYKI